MGNFQDVFLIRLSLFSNLKLMSAFYFIHKKFLVYSKLEMFKNCKEVKHIIMIVAIIYIFLILYDTYMMTVENYFQKIPSPPPEKIHSPLPFYSLPPKNSGFKFQVSPFCQHQKFFSPLPPCRKEGGHCDTVM